MRTPSRADDAGSLRAQALALALVPLGVLLGALLAPAERIVAPLVMPAALTGLVLPVVGYRVYHYVLGRMPAGAGAAERMRTFRAATTAAMGITACASLFGTLAFWFSGSPITLVGSAMHVIVVGAVWPSPERRDRLLRPEEDAR